MNTKDFITVLAALVIFMLGVHIGAQEECYTDAECAALCAYEDTQLPPDHPLYCDGGPN